MHYKHQFGRCLWPIDNTDETLYIEELAGLFEDISQKKKLTNKLFEYIALDTCGLSIAQCIASFKSSTDWVIAFQDDTPWNGSICCNLLDHLDKYLPSKQFKELFHALVEKYLNDAHSQEDASGISIVYVPKLLEAMGYFQQHGNNKITKKSKLVDWVSVAQFSDIAHKEKFLDLYRSAIVLCKYPESFSVEEARNGIFYRFGSQ